MIPVSAKTRRLAWCIASISWSAMTLNTPIDYLSNFLTAGEN
jgi:hypothetical protein